MKQVTRWKIGLDKVLGRGVISNLGGENWIGAESRALQCGLDIGADWMMLSRAAHLKMDGCGHCKIEAAVMRLYDNYWMQFSRQKVKKETSSLKTSFFITSPVTPFQSIFHSTPSSTTIYSCDTWIYPAPHGAQLSHRPYTTAASPSAPTNLNNHCSTFRSVAHIHRLLPKIPMSPLLA